MYYFPGFWPKKTVYGIFRDSNARVIKLNRRGKKLFAAFAEQNIGPRVIVDPGLSVTFPAAMPESIWNWKSAESSVAGAVK